MLREEMIEEEKKGMKKQVCKRLIAMMLAVVMTVSLLPTAVFASLLDNQPAYNREILSQLREICGSKDGAERYYGLLQDYHLLEEDGSAVEHWAITMDGKEMTLAELRALLNGSYDGEQIVEVDGTPVSLADLAVILEIEDYIAHLRETYFTGHQWTQEQKDNLDSLMGQLNSQGLQIEPAANGLSNPQEAHNVALEVTQNQNTFTFQVSDPAHMRGPVTFDWQALSGSQKVTGTTKGTVTLTAENPTATITVQPAENSTEGDDPVRSKEELLAYLRVYNVQNARILDGDKKRDAKTYEIRFPGTTEYYPQAFDVTCQFTTYDGWKKEFSLTEEQIQGIQWGVYDKQIELISEKLEFKFQKSYNISDLPTHHAEWVIRNPPTTYDLGTILVYRLSNLRIMQGDKEVKNFQGGLGEPTKESTEDTLVFEEPPMSESGIMHIELSDIDPSKPITMNIGSFMTDSWEWSSGRWNLRNRGKQYEFKYIWRFNDTTLPEILSVSAPEGTYKPGEIVPVTVKFSSMVDAEVRFVGDDQTYSAGGSTILTFPYTVKEMDSGSLSISSITAWDTRLEGGYAQKDADPAPVTTEKNIVTDTTTRQLPGVSLETPDPERAIESVSATLDESNPLNPVLKVGIQISDNEKLTSWLTTKQVDGKLYIDPDVLSVAADGDEKRYPIPVGDTITGQVLSVDIPLEQNFGTQGRTRIAELYWNGKWMMGKHSNAVTQNPVTFIDEQALSASIAIKKNGTQNDYTFENPDNPVIYVQSDMPSIQASFELNGTFTFGDKNKTAEDGTPEAANADFVWKSSNPDVAKIDEDGNIIPTGVGGKTEITLTARNGGVDGKAVTVKAIYQVEEKTYSELNFAAGLTPFLVIPNNALNGGDGQDVTVYWSSNLCDKNGETPTEFTVELKRGSDPVDLNGNEEGTCLTVSGTAEKPVSSVTIPGKFLEYDYSSGNNTFTVTVSARYGEKDYTATATICLESKPAQVSLNKLENYYILDTAGSVDIGWNVRNLDRASGEDVSELFKFQITKGGQEVAKVDKLELVNGAASGTVTLDNLAVHANQSDPSSYRQVYTVTLQAKNGKDSTWSYDSFLLYVYDADALKIMVDGNDQSSVTMSNVSRIADMKQDQILALKRDIYLKNIISANYGEYAWSEVADQIMWKSADNKVATVNYQQGTLYDNIENFSYTSYRPTTDFGLSGLSDGSTTVTATHKLTGMTDSLNVQVETLKDKLYLFQCYPQTQTTLTFEVYTDASKTAKKPVEHQTKTSSISSSVIPRPRPR